MPEESLGQQVLKPLKNKTAIISGASRGIGRSIAIELAQEGANISFNFLKSSKEALELEAAIIKLGVKAKAYQVDIKDFKAVEAWVEASKEFFGGLDIVINNAGIIRDKALAFMELEDWREVLNTNLEGAFNLTRSAIISLLKQNSGSIVNISSVSGIVGLPKQTNYSASKGGLIAFTKALAKEVAPFNVRVNAVAPGFIETEMLKNLNEKFINQAVQRIPLGRMGKPEEVAKAVKFLVSEDARYITGQTIIIDGGMAIT